MVFLQAGKSQSEIADALNRSKRIISREIRRNSFKGKYDSCNAQVAIIARLKFVEKAIKQNPEVL
jgi:IS30 family transposase